MNSAKAREQRVYSLRHAAHYAQRPPSRTVRFISNVEVSPAADADAVSVRSNLLVLEFRPGDRQQVGLAQQRLVGAKCEHRLRREDGWKILLKKVLLVDRDAPIPNLTFIV